MNDAEEVELLYRYVDGDMELLRKIRSTTRRGCMASRTKIVS
jgi:hypothetical protein